MKFRLVNINEYAVLRDLVRAQAEVIAGQVRILEKEIPTEWGPVMLGMDAEGRPVILLLFMGKEEEVLPRLIGVYRWTVRSMPLLIRFCAKGWLDTSKIPRFVVIVPGPARPVQESLGLLVFTTEAYSWRGVEIDGELSVLLEPTTDPSARLFATLTGDPASTMLQVARLTEAEAQFFERGHLLER